MAARLPAGELNRRISLVSVTTSQDATGEPLDADGPPVGVWAKLIEQRVSEVFSGASDQVNARVIFRIRKREVSQTDKVTYAGVRYEITGIQEYGMGVGLDLICQRLGENV